jgi:hypothetical protein
MKLHINLCVRVSSPCQAFCLSALHFNLKVQDAIAASEAGLANSKKGKAE